MTSRILLASLVASAALAVPPTATSPATMHVAKGFKVELLYAVPGETQGSWVAMAIDPKGRLTVSDQYGDLYTITPPPLGSSAAPVVEKIAAPIGEATGLVWMGDVLYAVVCQTGKYASGLYRVTDTNGDGALDKVEFLRALEGKGDHGPHQVLLSPDGKSLIVITGNHTKPTEVSGSTVPLVWAEDHLLPRMWDARGHAKGVLAPGGCIYRVTPDGEDWTLLSMGYRNQYDAALNRNGDLFSYDSDMEWDMNTPWYRPTRVMHAVSGSEFGWRSGTGKWPATYPDNLPPVIDIGPGSPTSLVFGYGAKFPAKYQDALYICDWSYGKLYALHLTPSGGTYKAEREEFVQGQPLALTDVLIRPQDGAMYFTTGGRKVQSALYRVTYTGSESTAPAQTDTKLPEEFAIRAKLEAFHGKKDPQAAAIAWPYLGHPDRFVRWAARVAIEHQDLSTWPVEKLQEETNPQALITAALAGARVGGAQAREQVLKTLGKAVRAPLTDAQQIDALRVLGLIFIRTGAPDDETRGKIVEMLDTIFPSQNRALNVELAQMLIYLDAPSAAAKTVALLEAAPTQEEQLDYAKSLRVLKTGWTPELRKTYFSWFLKAASYKGGASFQGFVKNIKDEAVAMLDPAAKAAVQPILDTVPKIKTPQEILAESLAGRTFVKAWTLDELAGAAANGMRGRNFDRGRKLFADAACGACHRIDGDGGAMGPDLTAAGGRFTPRDLIEAIIDPNKVVSDQYAPNIFTMEDGSQVIGRIVNANGDSYRVNTDMFDPSQSENVIGKKIKSIEPSKFSLMPPGLLNTLKEDEVLDLVAYLLSQGDRKAAAFR
ncbi:MAG: c-type cytochrome [Chthoniobacteraceae bacterium]